VDDGRYLAHHRQQALLQHDDQILQEIVEGWSVPEVDLFDDAYSLPLAISHAGARFSRAFSLAKKAQLATQRARYNW
jgi:hypothetical protein